MATSPIRPDSCGAEAAGGPRPTICAPPSCPKPGSVLNTILGLTVSIGVLVAAVGGAAWTAMVSAGSPGGKPPVTGAASGGAGPMPRTGPDQLWALIGGEPAPAVPLAGPPAAPSASAPADAAVGHTAETGPAPMTTTVEPQGSSSPPPERLPPAAGGPIDALDLMDPGVAAMMRAAGAPPWADPATSTPDAAPSEPATEPAASESTVATGPNLLDADSATLEGSTGFWKPWFSDTLTASASDGHSGRRSLRVRVTALHGWGVELKIWPGFAAQPGEHVFGFAARAESPAVTAATMTVHWHHDDIEIGSATLTLRLTDTWRETSALGHRAGWYHPRPDRLSQPVRRARRPSPAGRRRRSSRGRLSGRPWDSSARPLPGLEPFSDTEASGPPGETRPGRRALLSWWRASSPRARRPARVRSGRRPCPHRTRPRRCLWHPPTRRRRQPPPVRRCRPRSPSLPRRPRPSAATPPFWRGRALPAAGWVTVTVGQDLHAVTQAHPPATTFWLAPGIHTSGRRPVRPGPARRTATPTWARRERCSTGGAATGMRSPAGAKGVVIRHLTVHRLRVAAQTKAWSTTTRAGAG